MLFNEPALFVCGLWSMLKPVPLFLKSYTAGLRHRVQNKQNVEVRLLLRGHQVGQDQLQALDEEKCEDLRLFEPRQPTEKLKCARDEMQECKGGLLPNCKKNGPIPPWSRRSFRKFCWTIALHK